MAKKVIRRKNKTKSTQIPQRGLQDRIAAVEKAMPRGEIADFKPGDTVKVHARIKEGEKERIQIFEGVVIARYNRGAGKSFTVRKMSHGVGVERIFLEASPKIAKLEVAQEGRVRRAKLFYIRELEGKAARVERQVETQASVAQRQAAKVAAKAEKKSEAK